MIKAIRNSYRTYELFEITRLILDKPDRYVVVIKPWGQRGGKGDVRTHLFLSLADGFPFEREEEALNHIFKSCIGTYFDVEEIEVDPPTGNFQVINRCTLTQELLGPPNYHRYQEFLQRHFHERIHNMPLERYLQKVETVRDPDVVKQWLDKMRKVKRYRLKDVPEGQEAPVFENLEGARKHLLQTKKAELVMQVDNLRLSGKMVSTLPGGNIRRSIEASLENQKRFPLETANHLRSRLRRMRFAIYKRGSKGVSYLCAVKRKFREPGQVFNQSVQELIEFLEAHPMFMAADLPQQYLGLKPLTAAELAATAPSPAGPAAEGAPAAEPPPEELPPGQVVYAETPELQRLKEELHWLIMEGYVVEYGDGRLLAHPAMEPAKARALTSRDTEEEGGEEEGGHDAEGGVESAVGEPVAAEGGPVAADGEIGVETASGELSAGEPARAAGEGETEPGGPASLVHGVEGLIEAPEEAGGLQAETLLADPPQAWAEAAAEPEQLVSGDQPEEVAGLEAPLPEPGELASQEEAGFPVAEAVEPSAGGVADTLAEAVEATVPDGDDLAADPTVAGPTEAVSEPTVVADPEAGRVP